MSSEPLLSIVIPTRNRASYVEHAIRGISTLVGAGVELVIHDNSDTLELEASIRSLGFGSEISYYYAEHKLSMTENFELAVAKAKGEYVCLIGDDDGVTHEILEGVAWAKAQGLDALNSNASSIYRWPDLTMRYYGTAYAGTLSIPHFTCEVAFLQPEVSLRESARLAGQIFDKLPQLYYGIVKRDVLDRVREKAGRVFPGVSPDMAVAVAIACVAKRVAYVDYPLFICGNSAGSAAGLGARKQHWGRLEDQHHLPAEYVSKWSNLVPPFFSGSTMWGETFVSAVKAVGRDDLLAEFNLPLLHASCAVFTPRYIAITLRNFLSALKRARASSVVGMAQFTLAYVRIWLRRARALSAKIIPGPPSRRPHLLGRLNNIEEAMVAYREFLHQHGVDFTRVVSGLVHKR